MSKMEMQKNQQQEPHLFKKRIGTTTFHVRVYSNVEAKETAGDKIARLIRNEAVSQNYGYTFTVQENS